ncbi:MAG: hypothetical protein R3F30_05615 [Planctomycetota bacterium]
MPRRRRRQLDGLGHDPLLPDPAITGLSTSSITVVHDAAITVTGTGLGSATGFYWGSALITSQDADDWFKGWFQKVSATQVVVHPPQDQVPASYGLRVRNGYYTSNTVSVSVSGNDAPVRHLRPSCRRARSSTSSSTATGCRPTFDLLTFSVSGSSLVIPGLISLNHGGNAVTFIDPSFTIITIAVPHDIAQGHRALGDPDPGDDLARDGLLPDADVRYQLQQDADHGVDGRQDLDHQLTGVPTGAGSAAAPAPGPRRPASPRRAACLRGHRSGFWQALM